MHITKNLEISKALPGPPRRGPHQSLTSALPVKAWHITIALSRLGDNFPLVLYANGILCKVSPDSKVKDGIIAIVWSGMRDANGFSGCCCVLSCSIQSLLLPKIEEYFVQLIGDVITDRILFYGILSPQNHGTLVKMPLCDKCIVEFY